MLASGLSVARLPRIPGMEGSALGFGAAILATLVGRVLDAGDLPGLGLVLLAAVALAVGASTTLLGALGAAAQCWGLYSGFELHRYGELRLDEQGSAALLLLLALGVGASATTLAARVRLERRTPRERCWPLRRPTPLTTQDDYLAPPAGITRMDAGPSPHSVMGVTGPSRTR